MSATEILMLLACLMLFCMWGAGVYYIASRASVNRKPFKKLKLSDSAQNKCCKRSRFLYDTY